MKSLRIHCYLPRGNAIKGEARPLPPGTSRSRIERPLHCLGENHCLLLPSLSVMSRSREPFCSSELPSSASTPSEPSSRLLTSSSQKSWIQCGYPSSAFFKGTARLHISSKTTLNM